MWGFLLFKWTKGLNIKPGTLTQLIEEKVGKSLELIGTGGNFLNYFLSHFQWLML
jgi:hypothetical protein